MKKTNIFFQSLSFIAFAASVILILKKPVIEASRDDRTINVYVWGDFFNVDLIRDFEKRHNAKINLNYYLTNEELLAKIKNSNGNCADLIFPSDYAIKLLIQDNYLERIDYEKINFFNKLDPFILDKSFDPKNKYSLPYTWEVYGILSDKKNTDLSCIKTLKDLLENRTINKIVMPSDPIEVFCMASQALYNNLKK